MPVVNNITRLLDSRKIPYIAFELPVEKLGAEETARLLGVDSMLVFQMAAPCKKFSNELTELVHNAPLKSPLVTTFSSYDKACCGWHVDMEKEQAIGCCGVKEPNLTTQPVPTNTTVTKLGNLSYDYDNDMKNSEIMNVDASAIYNESGLFSVTGAHSDFFYEESIHLIVSLANNAR